MKSKLYSMRILSMIVLVLLFKYSATAQVTLFDSGFETGDPTFIGSAGASCSITQPTASNPNSGTNSGKMNGTANNTSFSGSIITGSTISFTTGKWYQITVVAKVACATSKLRIAKNATATDAAMAASTGGDQILWPGSNNVTSASYTTISALFKATATENKYVGFQVVSGAAGGCASTVYLDDITIIETDYPPCGAYCGTVAGAAATVGYIEEVDFDAISRTSAWEGYACTGVQANVRRTVAYPLTIKTHDNGAYNIYTAAWIDYNGDGDWLDAGENIVPSFLSNAAAAGTTTTTPSITIPAGATLGIFKMRVMSKYNSAITGPCDIGTIYMDVEDYDVNIMAAPVNMVYTSTTVTQITSSVNAGTTKNQVLMIDIVTTGQLSAPSATQFIFTALGTTAVANITNAKMYFTGSNNTYSSAAQVGSTIATPPADPATMTFNTAQVLSEGDNYFWISYDVVAAAPTGNVIDAKLVSTTVGGTLYTLNANPAGNRPIVGSFPMSYVSSSVVQNQNPVAKGTLNNDVISLQVVTTGAITPLSMTSITFRVTGTTNLADISNARVYFTADNPTFSTAVQFGSTLASPPASPTNFVVTGAATLVQGTNYFWLAYDVSATAACNPAQIDGVCTTFILGGVSQTPSPTAPAGARIINCGSPYYSQGNLNACLLSSWNSQRNGSGTAPASFAAGNDFYIQNGHTMSTSAAITIPHLYVETGGYIVASNLITMTDLLVETGATFEQTAAAPTSNTTYITNFTIKVGGTWKHNNSGALPGVNRYFDPYSIQWFLGIGGGTFPSGTNWGTVIIDVPTIGNLIINATSISYIHGDFIFKRWGNGTTNQMYVNYDNPITVDGDMYIQGGICKGMAGFNCGMFCNCNQLMATPVTLDVAGSLYVSGGEWDDIYCAKSGSTTGTAMTVGGNVSITGGILNLNTIITGNTNSSTVHLEPIVASTTWSQTGGTVTLPNTFIDDGKTVTLTGSKMGDVYTAKTIQVGQGASGALYCDVYPVSGAGNFSVMANAKLGMANAAGYTGNVTVSGTKTNNAGADFIYYLGNTQNSGIFTTTAGAGTTLDPYRLRSLTIDKTSLVPVTLQQPLRVTGTAVAFTAPSGGSASNNLQLINGLLTTTTANVIQVDANATANIGSATSFVNGPIVKKGTNAFTFPTGKNTYWARIQMTAPTAASDFSAEYFDVPYANTSTMAVQAANLQLNHVSQVEHWIFDRQNGTTGNTTLKLYWENATRSFIYKCDSMAIARWNGSAWENTGPAYAGPPCSFGATGNIGFSNTVTSFSPFTFSTLGVVALNPLPIELTSFTANCSGKNVVLNWSTASETNNDYFTIEKSVDGHEFIDAGTVKGKGNSSSTQKYSFTDREAFNGKSYYRLKQTDFNGQNEHTNVITAENCVEGNVTVNAYNNQEGAAVVFINSDRVDNYTVTIMDALGNKVLAKQFATGEGENQFRIDISSLNAGVYFISMDNGKKATTQKIFVR